MFWKYFHVCAQLNNRFLLRSEKWWLSYAPLCHKYSWRTVVCISVWSFALRSDGSLMFCSVTYIHDALYCAWVYEALLWEMTVSLTHCGVRYILAHHSCEALQCTWVDETFFSNDRSVTPYTKKQFVSVWKLWADWL